MHYFIIADIQNSKNRIQIEKKLFLERPHQAMLCFSFPRNFRKLTAINGNLDGLNCMAGMRLYTMFVIVFLHRNIFDYGSAMYNPVVIERHYSKFELSFVGNAPIVVETFFTISGFLATYLSLYNFHVQKKNINVIMQYIHRYIRMTPTYAVVLAFYCTLLTKMGNGPLWDEIVTKEQKRCRNNWWANLLYVNNYVDTDNYCMFQSWYVACDMNAFILVPIICLILCKKPKVGVAVLISLIIGFNLIALITVWTEEEDPIVYVYLKSLLNPFSDSTFKYVYIPGHMRAAPYYIGVLAAYIKYQINVKNYKFPKQYVRLGWILAVILMFTSLHLAHWFYIHDVEPVFKVLYAAFYHVAWSLSIAWMVIAISSGYGSWVEPLLSCPAAIILARLTYSVFVSHGIIMLVSRGGARYPIYAGVFKKIHSSAGDIFLAWILGFVLYMLIESPLIAFERVIFWTGSRGKKSVKKSPPETTTDLPTTN